MEQGLQRRAALLAGPHGAGGCGSPSPCRGAEGTQRGRGVRHLHGAGVREGAAGGAALWDPPKLQPRVLPGLHPHLAPQPGLPERGHQVSTRGGMFRAAWGRSLCPILHPKFLPRVWWCSSWELGWGRDVAVVVGSRVGPEPCWGLFPFWRPPSTHCLHAGLARSAGSPPATTSPTSTGSRMRARRSSSSSASRRGQGECAARWALCCARSRAYNRALNPAGKSGASSSSRTAAAARSGRTASTCTSCPAAGHRGAVRSGQG